MMKVDQNKVSAYRGIMKATTIFGGVQVYQIIIGIIKSKIIAVLLGPLGIGVQGLFTTATDLIKNITSLGLAQSAVKDVAESSSTGNKQNVDYTVGVLRKLVWITGLVGLFAVLLLSPFLSYTTFGNYDYTIPFIFLSVTLLFDQLCTGQFVVLQGLRKLQYLAKSSAYGSTVGLITSIPIYYLFGVSGIVPTLILASFTSLVLSSYFARKVNINNVKITYKEAFVHGKGMLKMGGAMCLNAVLATLIAFLLKAFIRSMGSTEDVGLYQAAFILTTTYANLVTNAIATDYYPRLTAVNKDNEQCCNIVNTQGEIAILILSPLLVILAVFVPIVISILYSSEFLPIRSFVMVATVGLLLRLGSWLLTYLLLAKGETKTFLMCELTAKTYTIVLNFISYYYWGLLGLGVAFSISFVVYFLLLNIVAIRKYSFTWSHNFIKLLILHLSILIFTLCVSFLFTGIIRYFIGSIFIVIDLHLCLKELDKRINLKQLISSKIASKVKA